MTQTDKDVNFITLYGYANEAKRFLDRRGDEVKNVAKTICQKSGTELFSQHLSFFEYRPQQTVMGVFHYCVPKKRENEWLEFYRLMWIEVELESQLIALSCCSAGTGFCHLSVHIFCVCV